MYLRSYLYSIFMFLLPNNINPSMYGDTSSFLISDSVKVWQFLIEKDETKVIKKSKTSTL